MLRTLRRTRPRPLELAQLKPQLETAALGAAGIGLLTGKVEAKAKTKTGLSRQPRP